MGGEFVQGADSCDGSRLEVALPNLDAATGFVRLLDADGRVVGDLAINRDLAAAVWRGLELDAASRQMDVSRTSFTLDPHELAAVETLRSALKALPPSLRVILDGGDRDSVIIWKSCGYGNA